MDRYELIARYAAEKTVSPKDVEGFLGLLDLIEQAQTAYIRETGDTDTTHFIKAASVDIGLDYDDIERMVSVSKMGPGLRQLMRRLSTEQDKTKRVGAILAYVKSMS